MRADEKGHWKRTDLVLAEAVGWGVGGGLMNISGKRLLAHISFELAGGRPEQQLL